MRRLAERDARRWAALWGLSLWAVTLGAGCGGASDCRDTQSCAMTSAAGAGVGGAVGGGGTSSGAGNSGGGNDGGSGGGGGCVTDEDCTNAGSAHCDGGACVPCSDSMHCAGVAGLSVCAAKVCVECALGEEGACTGNTSCDLAAQACVPVMPGSVGVCEACANDVQCGSGHRCIAMEFPAGTPHGGFCLETKVGPCNQPFNTLLTRASVSGAVATDYCAVDEALTTCEAVVALRDFWRCSGTDGMCSPDGVAAEVVTPGALCRTLGGVSRCTFVCLAEFQCVVGGPGNSCGGGPPPWCGG